MAFHTIKKRRREQERAEKQRQKQERRLQRKLERSERPAPDEAAGDPDIAHITIGPQPVPDE